MHIKDIKIAANVCIMIATASQICPMTISGPALPTGASATGATSISLPAAADVEEEIDNPSGSREYSRAVALEGGKYSAKDAMFTQGSVLKSEREGVGVYRRVFCVKRVLAGRNDVAATGAGPAKSCTRWLSDGEIVLAERVLRAKAPGTLAKRNP